MDWLTPEQVKARWADAEAIDDDLLDDLLTAAQDACEAYLPAEDDPQRPRDNTIRLAQLTLVRGLWNDALADSDGQIGADGFDYNPPWLAREARRMMRPQRAGAPPTGHDLDPVDDDETGP